MKKLFCLLPLLFLSSCLWISRGRHEKISINCEPPAIVILDDKISQSTPCVLDLKRNTGHTLVFNKDGYDKEIVVLDSNLSPAILFNLFFLYGAIIAIPIDYFSGAPFKLTPNTVNIKLVKSSSN